MWWDFSLLLFSSIILSLIVTLDSVSVTFFKINEFIKWIVILNIDMKKVWSCYEIINVWCIQIFRFFTIGVWVKVVHLFFLDLDKSSCYVSSLNL